MGGNLLVVKGWLWQLFLATFVDVLQDLKEMYIRSVSN